MKVQAVKGMNDVTPESERGFLNTTLWQGLGAIAAEHLESYGFRHVWAPVVEPTELFARGIGEGTDIVSKEMYTFEDRGGRSLTLRPEGTAGIVRAYIEHGLYRSAPIQKWWYMGPMFRAEAPQEGRYRQFYQIGAEFLGVAEPAADAELLMMLSKLLERLNIGGVRLRLNSLGDPASRDAYREKLKAYLDAHRGDLSEATERRIDANPLRFLDSKDPKDLALKDAAPDILDSLNERSTAHFDAVRGLLDEAEIPFERDKTLVRGLDYYSDTTFEFTTDALGAQDAVLGGGRYDGLVEQLGGPATPAVGFAAGVERLAMLLEKTMGVPKAGPDLYIVPMDGHVGAALALADAVREWAPFAIEVDVSGRKVKASMKRADKIGARHAIVIGEQEVRTQRGNLKDLGVSSTAEVLLSGEALAAAIDPSEES